MWRSQTKRRLLLYGNNHYISEVLENFTAVKAVPINLLKPTGHVMHHQFNIQQLYALPTLYLCVLYLSENKQRLVSQHKLIGFYSRDEKCLLHGTDWVFK